MFRPGEAHADSFRGEMVGHGRWSGASELVLERCHGGIAEEKPTSTNFRSAVAYFARAVWCGCFEEEGRCHDTCRPTRRARQATEVQDVDLREPGPDDVVVERSETFGPRW